MSHEQWTAADSYLCELLISHDEALDETLKHSEEAGLPPISVAPNQGKMLQLLAQMQNAHRVLEVGTLGGYSTIWMARALPHDGKLVTLEFEAKHAEVARTNVARAGFQDLVEVRVGDARETLQQMIGDKTEPFDFIFIDADKINYPVYLTLSLQLSRVGTVIVADNIVRNGEVLDALSDEGEILARRKFLQMVANESRLSATAIQTVGSKGYDGFAILRVIG